MKTIKKLYSLFANDKKFRARSSGIAYLIIGILLILSGDKMYGMIMLLFCQINFNHADSITMVEKISKAQKQPDEKD